MLTFAPLSAHSIKLDQGPLSKESKPAIFHDVSMDTVFAMKLKAVEEFYINGLTDQ